MNTKLSRRQFLGAAAGLAVSAPVILGQQRKKRNVVLILSDDHRPDFMRCTGHPWLKTPEMDKLVQDGVYFNNGFVTTSVCGPSRASILTGQYAHKLGGMNNWLQVPSSATMFPDLLQKQGYRTAFFGKWGFNIVGSDEKNPVVGFHHWMATQGFDYVDPVLNVNGQQQKVKGYTADILTDEALRFINKNKNRPFFVQLNYVNVHLPNIPAERHINLYEDNTVPLPKSMVDSEENYRGKPEWVRRQRQSSHGIDGEFENLDQFKTLYKNYCRTVNSLDESIGRVKQTLEENGLLNDTLILYLGDNGYLFGEHGLVDKRCMYEPSIRIPIIAHCPDLFNGGQRLDGFALNIDIAPTILHAANIAVPSSMHGRSLLELIQGTSSWRKDFLYEYEWETWRPMTPSVIGLRTEQYSYMQYHGLWDRDELYDVKKDPDQMNNLLADAFPKRGNFPIYRTIQDEDLKTLVTGFQKRMDQIMNQTGGRVRPTWSE